MTNDPHQTGLWWAAGLLGVAALLWFLRPPGGAARVRAFAWSACRGAICMGLAGFGLGAVVLGLRFRVLIPLVVLAIVAAVIRAFRWRGGGYAHGTARLAAFEDLAGAGMLSGSGLVMGRLLPSGRGARRLAIGADALPLFPGEGGGPAVRLRGGTSGQARPTHQTAKMDAFTSNCTHRRRERRFLRRARPSDP